MFRGGIEAFAARAAEAGVQVSLHVWHLFVPWLPEARQALAEIGDFLRTC